MTAGDPAQERPTTDVPTILSALLLAVGLLLMAFMIVTEDEPGALPLGLVLIGAVWLVVARRRARARRR
jgi:hypothetical protein